VIARVLTGGGKRDATSIDAARSLNALGTPSSVRILRSESADRCHRRIRISATPGQKKNAYAHALPQKATKLAEALLMDILSTTKAICDNKFCTNMFLTLWCTDSVRNSEPADSNEVLDADVGMLGR